MTRTRNLVFGLTATLAIILQIQRASCQIPTLPTPPPLPTAIPTKATFNATKLVDKVIKETRRQLIRSGLNDIQTPGVAFTVNNYTVAVGNGSIKGLANIRRVGDVLVTAEPIGIFKIRSAFGVVNVSTDADVDLVTDDVNYREGHIHTDVDNVTVYQVFKFNALTQTLTLDEFELSVGNVNVNVSGLGERAQNDSALVTEIIRQTKTPLLLVFNVVFKAAVNAALAVIRAALVAG